MGRIDSSSESLAEALGVSPVVGRVLLNRGITSAAKGKKFLHPSLSDLHDPYLMQDMERAIDRLKTAIERKERILVHGDYDVDGISGTAMMVRMLSALGADVIHHIPHRVLEGYGVSAEAIEQAASQGVGLVITVDCGIAAHEEALLAQQLGLDMIITDHHEPQGQHQQSALATPEVEIEIPSAVAVLNPKRPDCQYPFKGLCGCGVAFKLASALMQAMGQEQDGLQRAFLDLVALGTIADIVPLVDENRILAKFGLRRLNETRKKGLKALIEVAGLTGKELTSYHVGYQLGPRLNAVGRLDSALDALDLLLTRDEKEARRLADRLNAANRARQEEELATFEDVCFMIESGEGMEGCSFSLDVDKALVLASENWHAGVVGIVASRLAERFYRPAILIALEGNQGKGSGRSIRVFHLSKALNQCREHLITCGGHEHAAGLTIARENLKAFRDKFLALAAEELQSEDLVPELEIDCDLSPKDVTFRLANELSQLEPNGEENPKPVFAMRNATIVERIVVGMQGNHLKLRVKCDHAAFDCLWWRHGEYAENFGIGDRVDLCFSPEIDDYQGYPSLRLVVKDIRPAFSTA